MKEIAGKLLKLGDNVSTSQIVPEQYHTTANPARLAKHLLEGYADGFPDKIDKGNVFVAGVDFGCGPAPVPAVLALRAAGISGVVAKSFDRAFFRTAMNHGLLPVVADIVGNVNDGDNIEIDLEQGKMTYPDGEIRFPPYPDFVRSIIETGDLIAAVKKELGKK